MVNQYITDRVHPGRPGCVTLAGQRIDPPDLPATLTGASRATQVSEGIRRSPCVHASSRTMTAALYYRTRHRIRRAAFMLGIGLMPFSGMAQESAHASAPSVQASWGQEVVSAGQPLTIRFEGGYQQWGALVLMVGDTDVTHLFKPVQADRLEGQWDGELDISGEQVFKVLRSDVGAGSADTPAWQELANWPIYIEPAQFHVQTKGSVGMKSQPWGEWSGRAVVPARQTYADGTAQLTVQTDFESPDSTAQTEWQWLGSSARPDAVRYPLAGQDAPKPDLVDYRISLQRQTALGKSTVTAGQVSMDVHPLLAPGLTNRGIVLNQAFNDAWDLSLGVQAGARVLGVRNISGVEDEDSLFTSLRLGHEFLPERAGGLRAEVGWFQGKLKPVNLLNVAPVSHVYQRSQGWGVRLLGSTEDGRLSGEFNWARSRHDAQDPAQQALQAATGSQEARNWFLSYQVLPTLTQWQGLPVDMTVNLREDVTPTLYRSLGGGPVGDLAGRELGVSGHLGIVAMGLTLSHSTDNVNDDVLMLRNIKRQRTLDLSLPSARLPGIAQWISEPAQAVWWPQLSLTHQRSDAWADPDLLPEWSSLDELENVRTVERKWGLSWKPAGWTLACQWLQTFQDNRQAWYADQDMRSKGFQLEASWRVSTGLKLSWLASRNRQQLLDTGERNTGGKLGFSIDWRWRPDLTVKGSWSHQQTLDAFGATRKATDTLQLSLNGKTPLPPLFQLGWMPENLQGLWFMRLSASDNRSTSEVSYLNYVALIRSVQLGFSVAF